MKVVLDNNINIQYNIVVDGVWRSLVSRLVRVQEAWGSNPHTPTKNPESAFAGSGFYRIGIRKIKSNSPVDCWQRRLDGAEPIFSPSGRKCKRIPTLRPKIRNPLLRVLDFYRTGIRKPKSNSLLYFYVVFWLFVLYYLIDVEKRMESFHH